MYPSLSREALVPIDPVCCALSYGLIVETVFELDRKAVAVSSKHGGRVVEDCLST